MNLPRPIRKLIESFEKLPGIGPKTAARLTFYLLHVPQEMLDEFAQALSSLKKDTVLCSICFNVTDRDPCQICSDRHRNKSIICVVEQPLDVLALEKADRYQGVYHVLHGAISPLNNIGPDEIRIAELIERVNRSASQRINEIILATNPNMEGEATAMYIANKIRELKANPSSTESPALGKPKARPGRRGRESEKSKGLKLTRLGQGLPTGADLEYADEQTLSRALEGRRQF